MRRVSSISQLAAVAILIGASMSFYQASAFAQLGGVIGGVEKAAGDVGKTVGGAAGSVGVPAIGPNVGAGVGPTIGGAVPNVGPAVGAAVNGTVGNTVNGTVRSTLNGPVSGAINGTVGNTLNGTVGSAVNGQANSVTGNLAATANSTSRAALGVMFGQGTTVSNVINSSAASAAGLRAGDQILGINGIPVASPQAITSQLARLAPNQPVQLLIGRNGVRQTINATLGNGGIFNQAQQTVQGVTGQATGQFGAQATNALSNGSLQSTANAASQAALGVMFGQGMQISNVVSNSAAALAGLRVGDQILGLNGVRIDNPLMLNEQLQNLAPNQQVQLLIGRNGVQQTINATLGSVNQAQQSVQGVTGQATGQFGAQATGALSNGSLQSTANAASQAALGVMFGQGTQISNVVSNSAAALAGLRVGDQILGLNGVRIDNPLMLNEQLRNLAPNQQVQLLINRNGQQQTIGATLRPSEVFNQVNQLGQAVNPAVSNAVGQVGNTVNSLNAQAGVGANGSLSTQVGAGGAQVGANVDPRAVLGLSFTNGLQVGQLVPNVRNILTGVQVGDQIVSLNGTNLSSPQQLINNLLTVGPNQQLDLGVVRNGQLQHLGITINGPDLLNQVKVNNVVPNLNNTVPNVNNAVPNLNNVPGSVPAGVLNPTAPK